MYAQKSGTSKGSDRPRKNVTMACDKCRQRKVKCDIKEPQCSNCESHGHTCTYRIDNDRRKGPKVTKSRVQLLEQLLIEHGIPVPQQKPASTSPSAHFVRRESFSNKFTCPAAAVDHNLPAPIEPQVHQMDDAETPPQIPISKTSAINFNEPVFPYFANNQDFDQSSLNEAWSHLGSLPTDPDLDFQFVPDTLINKNYTIAAEEENANPISDDAVDLLAMRVGSLRVAEDGVLRFFGATSNLHLLQNSAPFMSYRGHTRTANGNISAILERAGCAQRVPIELEDHLIKLYLAWEDPGTHVVDGPAFWEARANSLSNKNDEHRSSYYSDVLVNAMCALGSTFTSRVIPDLPTPLSEFFASRSKALLDVEMDSPSIATVQALVILSAHEAAFTRDARGWLYSGMAIRLSVDLGLHLDLTKYIYDGVLNQKEAHVRKVTWWGIYMLDILWSYYMGRPPMLTGVKITVARLFQDNSLPSQRQWQPYIDDASGANDIGFLWTYSDPVSSTSRHTIMLCEAMEKLRQTLYTNTQLSNQQLERHIGENNKVLFNWYESLAPELQVDVEDERKIYLPHIIQLNMQYHEILIFANHPFVANGDSSVKSSGHTENWERICTDSASAIAKLLLLYQKQWSYSRIHIQAIHIVFSASLVNLYTVCADKYTPDAKQRALTDLSVCINALCQFSLNFNNGLRALDFILCIQNKWEMEMRSKPQERRANPIGSKGQAGNHGVDDEWHGLALVLQQAKETLRNRGCKLDDDSWTVEWSRMRDSLEVDPFIFGMASSPADGDTYSKLCMANSVRRSRKSSCIPGAIPSQPTDDLERSDL